MHLLLLWHYAVENTYKDAFIMFLSYYTCHHTCIRDILFHDHAYRINRGDNVAEIQRRRGRGLAGDSSSHRSRRRGAEPRSAPGVP